MQSISFIISIIYSEALLQPELLNMGMFSKIFSPFNVSAMSQEETVKSLTIGDCILYGNFAGLSL